jgi:hypothetical protein
MDGMYTTRELGRGAVIDEWIRSLIDLPLLDLALKKLSF